MIHYAAGQIPDRDGYYLKDRSSIPPLLGNIGLYAFSHPGIAAVDVLALYGDKIGVAYFVGRENPTLDTLTAVEAGYFDENNRPVLNPLYTYLEDYSPTQISIDYSSIRWDPEYHEKGSPYVGVPYFDLNGNDILDGGDHPLGTRVPTMYDKRSYSTALFQALQANGALTEANWPADVAMPDEAAALWPFRESAERYPELAAKTPDLKVMLVFADRDHVQPAPDKPQIHQAFNGFYHAADLWTRIDVNC